MIKLHLAPSQLFGVNSFMNGRLRNAFSLLPKILHQRYLQIVAFKKGHMFSRSPPLNRESGRQHRKSDTLYLCRRALEDVCVIFSGVKLNRGDIYQEVENRSESEIRRSTIILWVACTAVSTMPIFKFIFYFSMGYYSPDAWFLPFKVL